MPRNIHIDTHCTPPTSSPPENPLSHCITACSSTFAYDLPGRLLKAASPDAVVEYAYNRTGQVVSERVNGEEVRTGYDDGGQRSV
ncbi:hypothetical protein HKX68_20780, partial [Dickeya dadantii]